ncbi:MAG: aldehyde ferredoxin oxidoreductase family protein [Spirochaetes bacterium]|jgi:aldehyde:ferredoxin oxidoreductase|nr:aldehyde ferredoxin oxidoreductase family protein [Spirochaetota bacterium]
MKGFYGRILVIDLSARTFAIESLPDRVYALYSGGKGLASWLLYRNNPPGVDPLSPENRIIFATGPATGTAVWGGCRYGVFTKSPQTGLYSESYSGGKAPEAVDAAGFDAVILAGRSETPVVLVVSPEGAAFYDAGDLWGAETYTAEDEAVKRFGAANGEYKSRGAVVIGPAAENLVRFSVIENDYWRSAGRTGPGAVMGSKRVKAIVFQGDRRRTLADPEGAAAYAKETFLRTKDSTVALSYKATGTSKQVKAANAINAFPARYWSLGRVDHWDAISADALHARCEVRPRACAKCYMACGRMTTIKEGRHAGLRVEGPEYETIFAFGGLCMVTSIEEIAWLNDLCDRLGIDTMSCGNLCGFTIEAVRAGRVDFGIDYGDVDGIARLIRMIAAREGIGDVLAEGIRHAAREWGMEDRAVHVKGLEPAGYEPRVLKGMGLGYAVSDRGACHLRATFYKPEMSGVIPPEQVEHKAELFVDYEDRLTLMDTFIFCRFYRDFYQWDELAEISALLTGEAEDTDSLRRRAAAVSDLVRRFNIREGLRAEDDTLPRWILKNPLPGGERITGEELLFMRAEYYRFRNWDAEGRPKSPPEPV